MHIVHIGSEFSPIAKVGGLGDVIYGLSKQLHSLGESVLVVLPKYSSLNTKPLKGLHLNRKKTITLFNKTSFEVSYWSAFYDQVPLLLIEAEAPFDVFKRSGIYGEKDDVFRFLLFSYLAIEYLTLTINARCVVHLHDWQAAFVAIFYHELFRSEAKAPFSFLLTIHNLMHQGREDQKILSYFNLKMKQDFEDPQHPSQINLLKSGMIYANKITTVSPTYAKEILTPAFSYYLDATLWKCKNKIQGILNGIDLDYWNPYSQEDLWHPFFPNSTAEQLLETKKTNKRALQEKLHLKPSKAPLFCVISRLDTQKSPQLIYEASQYLIQKECQMIILGKTHDFGTKQLMQELESNLHPSLNFYFREDFDECLAKMLYAGCDFILIPSSFEPCGLTQMIAMRYGTVPVARKTGGLADTVIENPKESQTGFIFEGLNRTEMNQAIERAIGFYYEPLSRTALINKLFQIDHSWKAPAFAYLDLYKEL